MPHDLAAHRLAPAHFHPRGHRSENDPLVARDKERDHRSHSVQQPAPDSENNQIWAGVPQRDPASASAPPGVPRSAIAHHSPTVQRRAQALANAQSVRAPVTDPVVETVRVKATDLDDQGMAIDLRVPETATVPADQVGTIGPRHCPASETAPDALAVQATRIIPAGPTDQAGAIDPDAQDVPVAGTICTTISTITVTGEIGTTGMITLKIGMPGTTTITGTTTGITATGMATGMAGHIAFGIITP